MKRKSRLRIVILLGLVLALVLGAVPIEPVRAGPLQNFYESPIPYWDDDSTNVDVTWSGTGQTVNIAKDDMPSDWLTGWTYRKSVSITGQSGAGTNYPVNLTVTYDASMQSDFDDIRFTDNDGSTELDYWIENYTASTSASVWVEVADDLGSNLNIYMYYGNDAVSTTSDGDEVFLLFDDFTTLDAGKWSWSGAAVSGGELILETSEWIKSDDTFNSGTAIEARSKQAYTSRHNLGYGAAVPFVGSMWIQHNFDGDAFMYEGNTDTGTLEYPDGSYCVQSLYWKDADEGAYDIDRASQETRTDTDIPDSGMYVGIQLWGSSVTDYYADWLFVRTWQPTEPAFSSFGSEQTVADLTYDLDIGVPIERKALQEVEWSMDSTDLNSTVRFGLYSNQTASSAYIDVSSSILTYPDATTCSIYGNISIRFAVYDNLRKFFISVVNESGGVDYYNQWYVTTGNDWFRMTCGSFDGNFTLFYLEGDTFYLDVINRPEWSRTVESQDTDEEVVYGLNDITVEDGTDIQYELNYSVEFEYLQYLRTEWLCYWDFNDVNSQVVMWLYVDLYFPNGTVNYHLEWRISATRGGAATTLYVGHHSVWQMIDGILTRLYYWQGGSSAIYEYTWIAKSMLWRTQEDHLGVMWWDDSAFWNNGTQDTNESVWISPEGIDDWSTATVTLSFNTGHDPHYTTSTGSWYTGFLYNEYRYWADSGVAQPHFSSTWWDQAGGGVPGLYLGDGGSSDINGILGGGSGLGMGDEYAPPADDEGIAWWDVVGHIGAAFQAAVQFVLDAISGVLMAIPLLGAAIVSTIVDLFAPGAGGTIFSVLFDLGGTFVTILGMVPAFLGWVGWFLDHVIYWWNYIIAFVVDPQFQLLIGASIALAFLWAWNEEGAAGVLKVVKVCLMIVFAVINIVWVLFTGILGLIAGFLPGT